jgi:hypothetical protein
VGNELGKVIAESLKKAVRKVEAPLPVAQTEAAIRKATVAAYGKDLYKPSAAAIKRAAEAVQQKAVPRLERQSFQAVRMMHKPPMAGAAAVVSSKGVAVTLPDLGNLVKDLPKGNGTADVTYLAYGAYNNNLSQYIPKHLNSLETVGSTDSVKILAVIDGADKGSARKWLIQKDANLNKITSPNILAGPAGELDMSNAASLKGAVQWGFDNFPAGTKWLDLKDHGAGDFGFFQDAAHADPMRIPAAAQAILDGTNGKGVDVISGDMCEFMTAGMVYDLRKATRVLVGSSDETFPLAMHYEKALAQLGKNAKVDPIALAKLIASNVEMTGKDIIEAGDIPGVKRIYHISIADTSKAENMASAIKDLSSALVKALDTKRDEVVSALKGVKPMYVANHGGFDWNQRDLAGIANALKSDVNDPAVKAAADKVLASTVGPGGVVVQSAAAAEEGGALSGLTMYLPLDGKVDATWKNMALDQATGWSTFLTKLGLAPANAPAVAAAVAH